MINLKQFVPAIAVILLSVSSMSVLAMEGRELAQKVDENSKLTTDSAFNRFKLSTCKYGIKDKKLKCVEKPRVKLVESVQMNTGLDNKDTKSLAILLEPASEKGIGMLSYVYDDADKDNETWLYLSALGKVKRIASGNSDEESEPASLFGSEITTEDQETGKLDEYTYKILKEDTYKNRPVYILETTPTPERAKKSRYAKTVSWIDAERLITLKAQMYDKRGKAIKRIQMNKVELINDIWMPRSMTVMNLITSRLTNMALDAVTFGVDIDEDFLTQRALTDQAFRESNLNALRSQTQ